MMLGLSKGPFCQSCSMPLQKPDDFGTDTDGRRINDYCRHCYDHGVFVHPLIDEDAVIDKCVSFLVSQGAMTPTKARLEMNRTIPLLKRWRDRRETQAPLSSATEPVGRPPFHVP